MPTSYSSISSTWIRFGTGPTPASDNRLILDNLRALSEIDVDVWVRVPLIPGFNDDAANIEATGAFLEGLPRRHRVFVLPYHAIANGKRSRLEETAAESGLKSPGVEAVGAAAEAFAKHQSRSDRWRISMKDRVQRLRQKSLDTPPLGFD